MEYGGSAACKGEVSRGEKGMMQAQAVAAGQTGGRLSLADVARLTADPSADNRAAMAAKLAAEFNGSQLGNRERKIAEDIFRALVQDAEVRVREALSSHLSSAPDIPQDVALALAKDVDSVALPILEFCEALSDKDLIDIIQAGNPGKQEAVAKRGAVTGGVANALIDAGNERAVARLVGNDGAQLDQKALERVMTDYAGSNEIAANMAGRANLPAVVSEKLVNEITHRIQSSLVKKQMAPSSLVKALVKGAQEKATLSLLRDGCTTPDELEGLIDHLKARGRLTPSLAIEALSEGDLAFFEVATARLAGIPIKNARTLIHEQGRLGIESLLKSISQGLPITH